MENKLEQLLNMLCEKGWKPWGKEVVEHIYSDRWFNDIGFLSNELWFYTWVKHITDEWEEKILKIYNQYKLRELVSKESGLWQFVCENGLVKHDQYTNTVWEQIYEDERDSETYRTKYGEWSYLFRLIESALKDEDKLEDFILSNIKIDE